MKEQVIPVNVDIMGKVYRIGCSEKERDELLNSAGLVDEKMREMRDSGRVVGVEKIAVMAALDIAHEFMQIRSQNSQLSDLLNRLAEKIDTVVESAAAD